MRYKWTNNYTVSGRHGFISVGRIFVQQHCNPSTSREDIHIVPVKDFTFPPTPTFHTGGKKEEKQYNNELRLHPSVPESLHPSPTYISQFPSSSSNVSPLIRPTHSSIFHFSLHIITAPLPSTTINQRKCRCSRWSVRSYVLILFPLMSRQVIDRSVHSLISTLRPHYFQINIFLISWHIYFHFLTWVSLNWFALIFLPSLLPSLHQILSLAPKNVFHHYQSDNNHLISHSPFYIPVLLLTFPSCPLVPPSLCH